MVFVDWFIPGYKAGGQLRSCANLAYAMQGIFDIFVVTSDRDMGDAAPYPNIVLDEWLRVSGGFNVIYLSGAKQHVKQYASLVAEINPDCIYLNSMFSFRFTIMPIIAARRYKIKTKIVLAPRGMLHEGALQYKSLKKKIFLNLFRLTGVHKRLNFHATDATEFRDIKKVFGNSTRTELVDDFPATAQSDLVRTEKKEGELRCLFISRISPKKNLDYLLRLLPKISGNLRLSVIGPKEDESYYQQCVELAASLPSNISVHFEGAVPNHELPSKYHENHLFVLPTHGENFGHVIYDSFLNGRPVLISNLTPWVNLSQYGCGWDLSLSDEQAFVNALNEAVLWGQTEFDSVSAGSWTYAHNYVKGLQIKQAYTNLFT